MKKMFCDKCGVEFKYFNDLEPTPKGKEFEEFIMGHGGDYCCKCIDAKAANNLR